MSVRNEDRTRSSWQPTRPLGRGCGAGDGSRTRSEGPVRHLVPRRRSQWPEETWKQAMSYCETACGLFACCAEAVPGLPAYTVPACPFGLNGEPLALAELPGVDVASELPQVVPGAPGWPGPFGLGVGECR